MNKLLSKIVSVATAAAMTLFVSSGSLQTFINEIDAHAAETDVFLGDVNGDDRVDVFDLCLMKRELVEPGATSIDKVAADVNADGVVDIKDVIEVQQFLLVERDSFTGSMRKKVEPPDTSVVTTNQQIETSIIFTIICVLSSTTAHEKVLLVPLSRVVVMMRICPVF